MALTMVIHPGRVHAWFRGGEAESDSFFKSTQWLEQVFNITGKDPVTFMSHSVTGGLDYDSFFKALPRLQHYSASRARTLSRSCVIP